MGSKIYVGVYRGEERITFSGESSKLYYERFRAKETPTEKSHGNKYFCVIGPFRTVKGAEFMVKYGHNNPHVQCVSDAERLAKHTGKNDATD